MVFAITGLTSSALGRGLMKRLLSPEAAWTLSNSKQNVAVPDCWQLISNYV